MSDDLSHIDEAGDARMVDVSQKPDTERAATARGFVYFSPRTYEQIRDGNSRKGDILGTARLAGIMGAKRTGELIPLCHPLPLTHVDVRFAWLPEHSAIAIEASARCVGKTGVEMEALAAVSVAALTVFDMTKALDRTVRISDVQVVAKSGGRSGDWALPSPVGPHMGPETDWT